MTANTISFVSTSKVGTASQTTFRGITGITPDKVTQKESEEHKRRELLVYTVGTCRVEHTDKCAVKTIQDYSHAFTLKSWL